MTDAQIKDDLCRAFCGALAVHRVPAGYAVGTSYEGIDGDDIGFYVVGPDENDKWVVQDDGMCVSAIEAAGADLANKARNSMFTELREQYGVSYDKESGELSMAPVEAQQIGQEAIRFLGFMLRVQDLILTSTERTLSTFREEAALMIRDLAAKRAEILENYVIDPKLKEYPADLAIVTPGRAPVALFFGVSDMHVMEALLLQSYAEIEKIECKVMALLETEKSVSEKTRQRANNHLEAVPNFRGDEQNACKRIVREALGVDPTLH
jgi:hypothetical protein